MTNEPRFPDIHVLYVDADADLTKRVKRSLSRSFVMTTVASAAEARARLAEGTFQAIVADDTLPDGSGRALLAEVKAKHPDCWRILVASDDITAAEGERPWIHLMRKPFNPFALSRAVETYTRGAKYEGTVLGI
ncbi:MAG TPA: hypothetical protein VIF62_10675 [Labilithrix sp.]|jgi:DNA-binding NtrC family response regulator